MFNANAAQVVSGFVWKNELSKKILTGSPDKGFEVDQTVLLEYLMKFQTWVKDNQEQFKNNFKDDSYNKDR